jgi:hypothetical protein
MEIQSVETLEQLAVLLADRLANIPAPQPLRPILCTIPTGAQMIGRSVTFIYEALAKGEIRGVKSDKRTLLIVESLREYAANLPPAEISYPSKTKRSKRAA